MNRGGGLIVDLFAGGGGASEGIRLALGRHPDIAINHDPVAVAVHAANHPATQHFREDVWKVHPLVATRGRPVALLWASPDCKHFSKAKGGPPIRSREIRSLAWVVCKWAQVVRPRVIVLENVEEFTTWGPLDDKGRIINEQRGLTFRTFVWQLLNQGYVVEWRCLRGCDFGAPTIRRRLFLIARRDGRPIVWPEPTHGSPKNEAVRCGHLLPWRTAAEIIDWSIPCPSIFERKKSLAENTLRRIAEGIRRYVVESADPFIVSYYGPKRENDFRGVGISDPLRTQTTENRFARVAPSIARLAQTGGNGKYCNSVEEPLTTITSKAEHLLISSLSIPVLVKNNFGVKPNQAASDPMHTITTQTNKFALVSAFLLKHYGGVVGSDLNKPVGTVTTVDHHSVTGTHLIRHFGKSIGCELDVPAPTTTAGGSGKTGLVTSHLLKLRGTCRAGQPSTEPMPTVTAGGLNIGEVRAFLQKYYGQGTGQSLREPAATLTTKDRLGLVTVTIGGEPYLIVDIGMRMLAPRELFRAQGFPDSYQIDVEVDGRRISKTDQVRLCGNSVCPPVARALVEANVIEGERRDKYEMQMPQVSSSGADRSRRCRGKP